MNKQIERLADLVREAEIITYYTGAGTSTESGIPDYRSELGRWTVMKKNNMDPVYFANKKRITENPEKFLLTAKKITGRHSQTRLIIFWLKWKKTVKISG